MSSLANHPAQGNHIRTNAATLYELAAECPGRGPILIAYCYRRTRRGLYNALVGRLEHVQRVIGTTNITFNKKASTGATMGAWRIFWSGRTQRDAVHGESELPFIADIGQMGDT